MSALEVPERMLHTKPIPVTIISETAEELKLERTTPPALAAIIASEEIFITPEEVAAVLGVQAQSIRLQAHENPAFLGFAVCVIKTRTYIPRIPFLRFLGVEV